MTVIYDIETYPNVFSLVALTPNGKFHTFIVSNWHNDFRAMRRFLEGIDLMVGFNNLGFDYPVLHTLLHLDTDAEAKEIVVTAYKKAQAIIDAGFHRRNDHVIWHNAQEIKQLDLFKIHHFDNAARTTSLKMLEFVTRQPSIKELPFDPRKRIAEEQIEQLKTYNQHDVKVTFDFFKASADKIQLRKDMGDQTGKNFMTASDAKLGSEIMILELEAAISKDICYYYEDGERHIRNTKRDSINLGECIFDYVRFNRPEFRAILNYLKAQTIRETKGVFTELEAEELRRHKINEDISDFKTKNKQVAQLNVVVEGLKYVFGTGGLHACVDPGIYRAEDGMIIVDWDVTSYYPSLGIKNRIYPEHLGPEFCDIYEGLLQRRLKYPKTDPNSKALKLALNATYGNSNNQFSPFYDPAYTMKITLNGQLLLCMLAEMLLDNGIDVRILQANTDGITVMLPEDNEFEMLDMVHEWMELTKLQLERTDYEAMLIRDVNNYIAVKPNDGGVKRKGAYEYVLDWHQNHSQLVVPKAAEAHMVRGIPVRQFLEEHEDMWDFMLRTKITGKNELYVVNSWGDARVGQNITRYYVSKVGFNLMKRMPPSRRKLTKKLLGQFKKLGAEWTEEELEDIRVCLDCCRPYETTRLEPNYIEAAELCDPCDRFNLINAGYCVTIANEVDDDFLEKMRSNIDFDYYEAEVNKLLL